MDRPALEMCRGELPQDGKRPRGQVPAASFRGAPARGERQLQMRRFASSTASKSWSNDSTTKRTS